MSLNKSYNYNIGTIGNINVTGITAGIINATGLSTLVNATVTNVSAGTLTASTGLTTGTINATGLSTFINATATNVSAGTLIATTSITSGLLSATNIVGNSISAGTLSATTITGANLSLSGNLSVAGTLTTVNITSTNMLNTNISAGTINATGLTSLQNVTLTNVSTGTLSASTGITVASLRATGTSILANVTTTNVSTGTLIASTGLTASGDFSISANSGTWNSTAGKGIFMRYSTASGQDGAYIQSIDRTTAITYPMTLVTQSFNLETNNGNRIHVTSTGNVGINTTSPGSSLHVAGTINVSGTVNTQYVPSCTFLNNSNVGNSGVGSFLAPNMPTSTSALTYFGRSLSSGNSCSIGYTYVGNNNDANSMSFLHYGKAGGIWLLNNGNVGINNASPGYTLEVNGTAKIQNPTFIVGNGTDNGFKTSWNVSGSLGEALFYDYKGGGNGAFYFKLLNTSNQDVGWAPITAGAYTNASDSRIKTNIIQIDSQEAINMLRSLQPMSYTMKDKREDQTLKYGFIAQEVENYIPAAVNKSSSIIPNFQKHCTYTMRFIDGNNKYELYVPSHNLNNGDKIRINFEDLEGDHEVEIQLKNSDNIIFEHTHKTSSDTIFLYGSQIHDFRTLDYNMIYTILHSATKEIDKHVQQLEQDKLLLFEKIQHLETRLNEYTS